MKIQSSRLAPAVRDREIPCIARPGWEEGVHPPEVLRIEGVILQQQGKFDESEQSLRAAIEVARGHNAKSWGLRIATTLTRPSVEGDRRSEARDLLSTIYRWFSEGFRMKDLKEAKALLVALS